MRVLSCALCVKPAPEQELVFSEGVEQDTLFEAIMSKEVAYPSTFSPEATAFVKGLLNRDPEQRLGSHPRRGEEQLKASVCVAVALCVCVCWHRLPQLLLGCKTNRLSNHHSLHVRANAVNACLVMCICACPTPEYAHTSISVDL